MTQPLIIGLLTLHGVLWWLGGWGQIPPGKSWRRHILPVISTLMLIVFASTGKPLWILIGAGVVQIIANTNGYGEDDPIWKRILTLLMLGLPAVVLDHTLWWIAPLYVGGIFAFHYALSRKFNRYSWPIVEFTAGVAQGSAIIYACNV